MKGVGSANKRHIAIINEYDRLVAAEKAENQSRARHIAKGYYIELLSRHPTLGMSEEYIRKIINGRYKLTVKADD